MPAGSMPASLLELIDNIVVEHFGGDYNYCIDRITERAIVDGEPEAMEALIRSHEFELKVRRRSGLPVDVATGDLNAWRENLDGT